jgi:hypothetical protein
MTLQISYTFLGRWLLRVVLIAVALAVFAASCAYSYYKLKGHV